MNPAAEDLLGVSRERAAGGSLVQLVDDARELEDLLVRVATTSVTCARELPLVVPWSSTRERIVDCRVSLMQHAGHEYFLVEMTDVTRRTRINRDHALMMQHGAGRLMIRQLAHEIKNPLGGLRGAAQLLARELASAELREYTKVIISETDRLVALVDTLLGPAGPPQKQPVSVHELLEHVIRLVEADGGPRLSIRRDYDTGLPPIELDRDQMVQAFLNLLKNAATALEGHGTITVRTRATTGFTIADVRHGTIASVEIEDDGPGIPPELQESVFYPLVTGRPEGTGLGLSVAQDLVSRHGGLIEFDSRPGRTVFCVRLPLRGAMS